jgi:hypothetical protein
MGGWLERNFHSWLFAATVLELILLAWIACRA